MPDHASGRHHGRYTIGSRASDPCDVNRGPAASIAEPAPVRFRPAPSPRPLPPVEQVRPGLWGIPVPLPGMPRYVIVHVLDTDRGPYLVDAGWDTDDAWTALTDGLRQIGTTVADVQGVLVTHAHLDHYGLAGRVRQDSGAWVALHPADTARLDDYESDPVDREVRVLRAAGAPAHLLHEASERSHRDAPLRLPRPDHAIEDGARLPVPGWDLAALWTPGHSPGHVCFWEGRRRLLLSGDHVLPRFAVGMSERLTDADNPLGDYLDALDRLGTLDPVEVLPAHEYRFTELHPRLDQLRRHHRARTAGALAALRGGAEYVWDVASAMTWQRPLAELRGFALLAALIDADACLAALRARGQARSDPAQPGQPRRWHPVS